MSRLSIRHSPGLVSIDTRGQRTPRARDARVTTKKSICSCFSVFSSFNTRSRSIFVFLESAILYTLSIQSLYRALRGPPSCLRLPPKPTGTEQFPPYSFGDHSKRYEPLRCTEASEAPGDAHHLYRGGRWSGVRAAGHCELEDTRHVHAAQARFRLALSRHNTEVTGMSVVYSEPSLHTYTEPAPPHGVCIGASLFQKLRSPASGAQVTLRAARPEQQRRPGKLERLDRNRHSPVGRGHGYGEGGS